MAPDRHGTARVEFPNELEIVLTRDFDAPIQLVFDVLTKPEHVTRWFAPYDEKVTVCEIDLRVGGDYHIVMVTSDGTECSFRGTYLEIEPPARTVETWIFEGWPGVEAVESTELRESGGVTTLTQRLAFPDKAARAHMDRTDGYEKSFDNVEDHLRALLDTKGTASA